MRMIRNRHDLLSEKRRLKLELVVVEADLKNAIQSLKEEWTPSKIISGLIKDSFTGGTKGIAKLGLNKVLDFLLKNIFLSRAGWVTKTAVSLFAKNFLSGYISENNPEILDMLKTLIRKARKFTKQPPSYFDKSTVDEMDL